MEHTGELKEETQRELEEVSRRNAFSLHNHIAPVSIVPDRARMQLVMHPDSWNPYGMAHGGALFTLADDTAGTAAHTDGRTYVTQSATLHFLRNQPEGILTAEAVVRHRGGSTCLVDVNILGDGDALLATGEFSYFRVDRKRLEREAGRDRETQSGSTPAGDTPGP